LDEFVCQIEFELVKVYCTMLTQHTRSKKHIHNVASLTWYTIIGGAEQPNNKVNNLRK